MEDIREELIKIKQKEPDIDKVLSLDAKDTKLIAQYMIEYIKIKDEYSRLVAEIRKKMASTSSELQVARSIAHLDKAVPELQNKGIKFPTVDDKKAFCASEPGVLAALEKYSMLETMLEYVLNKKESCSMSHYTLKMLGGKNEI